VPGSSVENAASTRLRSAAEAWMSPAAAIRIVLTSGSCPNARLHAAASGYDGFVPPEPNDLNGMMPTLKRSAAALRDAGIPFLVAGGVASWVRGGPATDHDLDFLVKPDDAERALAVLADAGLRPERPPEEWLFKAFDGDVMVDLIFNPAGLEITDEVLERGEEREVEAMTMRVMQPEDLLVTKLMAMTEHTINYRSCLEIARALREQVDWDDVRRRTASSPFACAFFVIAEGLGVVEPA
jgi:predicted nucleotidyltransferase